MKIGQNEFNLILNTMLFATIIVIIVSIRSHNQEVESHKHQQELKRIEMGCIENET